MAVLLPLAILIVMHNMLYYPPAGLTVKVNEFITYPNGTTVTNPYSMLQFGKGGLAVLMFSNGTTLTFNITSISGFRQLYEDAPWAFMRLNWAVILIAPDELKGWVTYRGRNITLNYFMSNIWPIPGVAAYSNNSMFKVTYTLDSSVLQEVNKTSPALLRYIPYNITLIVFKPKTSGDLTAEADSEWILTSLFGLTVARSQQWVEYEMDCMANIYWATAWINDGGIAVYSFQNAITIAGQEWSNRGPYLDAPRVNFSPPASQVNVKESTGFYFGISVNGYGVSGQVASGFSTRHQEQ